MTPRSLVGMTMGARKRAALYESLFNQDTSHIKMTNKQLRMVWRNIWPLSAWARSEREKLRKPYRIGQRLRPCPGCAECDPCMIGYGSFCGGDPRLFTPDEECSTEQERERHRKHCEEWSSGKRLTDTDSDKLVDQAPYGLGVSRWTNNSAGTFCDGSGVLPARAKKVRR